MNDVPEINVSTAPCGSAGNPHVVRSPTVLFCDNCRVSLAGILLDRMRAALASAEEMAGAR